MKIKQNGMGNSTASWRRLFYDQNITNKLRHVRRKPQLFQEIKTDWLQPDKLYLSLKDDKIDEKVTNILLRRSKIEWWFLLRLKERYDFFIQRAIYISFFFLLLWMTKKSNKEIDGKLTDCLALEMSSVN